jgi:hypothetical protein
LKAIKSGLKLPSPPGYDQAYAQSYELAFDTLIKADLENLCIQNGASLTGSKLRLDFLNLPIIVDIEHRVVSSSGCSLSISDKLIMLHYLVTADGRSKTGKLISFKDVPDGVGYFPTFYKRAIAPIVAKFANSFDDLKAACAALGGTQIAIGDIGVAIPVFPRVTLNWVLWRGEGVLPTEGSILFDSSLAGYLPIEDIAALCQSIAFRLCDSVS